MHTHLVLLCVALVMLTGSAVAQPAYTFESFVVPDGGGETIPTAVSARGEIAGHFIPITGGGYQGFVRDHGVFTILGSLDGFPLEAWGIDASGMVVGDQQTHAFLWVNGVFTLFDIPGSSQTTARGINNRGQIVGEYQEELPPGRLRGFIKNPDSLITFDALPGVRETHAFGINNRGQVVGLFKDPVTGATRSFLKDGDIVMTVEMPGATVTAAFGINDRGQLVGSFYDSTGMVRGFVTDGAAFTVVDVPGAKGTEARGINAEGQIVGDWGDGRIIHGFIATPSP